MILLGLAGAAGAGKDTVADYLASAYGFLKFSFSDALYREVQEAYCLPDESLLRDRDTKEKPQGTMRPCDCQNDEFRAVLDKWISDHAMWGAGMPDNMAPGELPMSPRQVLQLWGTEYRRVQDPDYWIIQADRWMQERRHAPLYPEHSPQLFVNTSVRFDNERDWIHSVGGNVWHIRREGFGAINGHVAEVPLPVIRDPHLQWHERELFNNDTVERLQHGIDLMLRTGAEFVRVEPMAPAVEPPADAGAEPCYDSGPILDGPGH